MNDSVTYTVHDSKKKEQIVNLVETVTPTDVLSDTLRHTVAEKQQLTSCG